MRQLNLIPFLCVLLLPLGCGRTLHPGGPYHSDMVLYGADMAITTGYAVIQSFVKWEYDNRFALATNPEIKSTADRLRLETPLLINNAMALRDVYAAAPTSENQVNLSNTLQLIRMAVQEATKLLAENQN